MPTAKVIRLSPTRRRWQGNDPVFLHFRQLEVGVVLTKFGRLDHGTMWRITTIKTYSEGGRTSHVRSPRRPTDTIILQRLESNETHQLTAIYLSYSAIWRLPQ